MAKSSIHFSPVKSNSEVHNNRLVKLDYNFPELEENNEHWQNCTIAEKDKQIRDNCQKLSGRKMMKNAVSTREAVVNLDRHHTMDDLKILCKRLKKDFQIDAFQIHIHRDEGKDKDNLNYHAHILFGWQNLKKDPSLSAEELAKLKKQGKKPPRKTCGKILKLTPQQLSQIQDITAEVLGMERGELRVNSNRERLEATEYKRQQEELELKRLSELKKKSLSEVENYTKVSQTAENVPYFLNSAQKRLSISWKTIKNDFQEKSNSKRLKLQKLNTIKSSNSKRLTDLKEKYSALNQQWQKTPKRQSQKQTLENELSKQTKLFQGLEQKLMTLKSQYEELKEILKMRQMQAFEKLKSGILGNSTKQALERVISKNSRTAYKYATEVLNAPFKEGEKAINRDMTLNIEYAKLLRNHKRQLQTEKRTKNKGKGPSL